MVNVATIANETRAVEDKTANRATRLADVRGRESKVLKPSKLTGKRSLICLQLRTALVSLQHHREEVEKRLTCLRAQQDVVADLVQRGPAGFHLALQRERQAAVARARREQPLRQPRVLLREQGYLWRETNYRLHRYEDT